MKPRPPLPSGPYLVIGLARSGASAALALRARGERVIGVDRDEIAPAAALEDAGVEMHLGGEPLELLERAAAVVKSPGVPAQAPLIEAARARAMPVLGELELAWRMLENEFIAVTGTNGKTTTVELIGHIHREASLPVAVAGNVGTAVSSLVGALDPGATVACEASSFQLQDTVCFSPEAAVLINLTPDHLDRHGSMDAYLAAKLQAFARQDERDVAVAPVALAARVPGHARLVAFGEGSELGASPGGAAGSELDASSVGASGSGLNPTSTDSGLGDVRAAPELGVWLHGGELHWHGRALLAVSELRVRGRHNVENAMAAASVCLARGIAGDTVVAALRSFAGVAHRLEEVAAHERVAYVNDSKATNVASTLVALEALSEPAASGEPRGLIHVILGGQGKGQDFSALRAAVQRSCRAVYLIGEDAPRIAAALAGVEVPVHDYGDLEHALARAERAARAGEVVLLSPACASFDQFENFEARGDRFRELARNGGARARASK